MNRFEDWEEPYFDEDGFAYWLDNIIPQRNYGWRCQHHRNLKLGKGVDIGCFTYMNAKFGIEIGKNTQLGGGCLVYSYNSENNTTGPVKIGKNCLIGANTTILPNSNIPNGSKIKIGSIVTVDGWGKTIVLEDERKKKFL